MSLSFLASNVPKKPVVNKILANAYTERKNPITPMVLKNHLYWIVRLPASM